MIEKKENNCKYCRKKFSRKHDLTRHLNICKQKESYEENQKLKEENRKLKIDNEYTKDLVQINNVKKKFMTSLKKILKDKFKEGFNGYIYLLQEREFIKTNEDIYKIGKTVNPKTRLGKYPKGSIVHLTLPVGDCDKIEVELLKIFDLEFIIRRDVGLEYFEGNLMEMVKRIIDYIN